MNRAQLDLCLQGADLLKGHLRGLDRSLDSAIKRQDRPAVEAALDPLVHVAGVLIRKLAIVSETSGSAAFTAVVAQCDPEYANEYDILESLLSIVIGGGVPDRITCNTALLAIAAQEVGANAIGLIAETTHEHPFKVVGGLTKLLNAQGPSVQLTDNASASAALSMEPPMVLVSLGRGSETLGMVPATGRFGLNVQAAEQGAAATSFAEQGGAAKFDGTDWEIDRGLPRVLGAPGWIACTVERFVGGGDHVVALGNVIAADTCDGGPLVYHRRLFGTHIPHAGDS